jgi:type I restriction enzyme, R subunit
VYDLRAKLDASGHYDDFEVDRVVAVEMNPKSKQGDLIAALEPVADRLLKQFKQAQESLQNALAKSDEKAVDDAKGQMNALILFKADMGAFQRMYSFLSQIFDYQNTNIEKRFIFYRRLSPLLEFGR